jgi:hypothetical protein
MYYNGGGTVGISAGGTSKLVVRAQGLSAVAGTAEAPSYSFSGSLGTGMYRPGANILCFSTNGLDRMRITSAGAVQCSGALSATGRSSMNDGIVCGHSQETFTPSVGGGGTQTRTTSLRFTGSGRAFAFIFDSNADLSLYTSSGNNYLPRFTFSSAGNFIATGRIDAGTSFYGRSGDSAGAPSFSFTTDKDSGMYSAGTDEVGISTNGVSRMVVSNAGTTIPNPGTLSFGSSTRQMLNLFGTAYALGVQNNALYLRSGTNIYFYGGGVHSNTNGAAGTGGTQWGSVSATGFSGGGGGLTSLTPANFAAGTLSSNVTVPWARLSDHVSVSPGNGLTGGGALNVTRTLTLGTPGTCNATTTNDLQTNSHTHAISSTNSRTSTSTTLLLEARAMNAHRISDDHDGRYVNKAGDTLTGNFLMQPASGSTELRMNRGNGDTFAMLLYDSTNSGGRLNLQSTAGTWSINFQNSNSRLNFRFNGSIRGYLNSTVNGGQLNFTGQHRNVSVDPDIPAANPEECVGKIVCSAKIYATGIHIDEALPNVVLSRKRNDKNVYGVISRADDGEYNAGVIVSVMDPVPNRLVINSLGEGAMWVCDVGGALEAGDYITSSEIPGLGMRQDDDFLHNYTVAKITCDCSFEDGQQYVCETIEFEGKEVRRAFVGVTYHCG